MMKEKKHIDRLFSERFKDFEATPPPEVWERIKEKLNEEEDRKAIPIWWKLGGIAALLALLFTVGQFVFDAPGIEGDSDWATEQVESSSEQDTSTQSADNNNAVVDADQNDSSRESETDQINAEIQDQPSNADIAGSASDDTSVKRSQADRTENESKVATAVAESDSRATQSKVSDTRPSATDESVVGMRNEKTVDVQKASEAFAISEESNRTLGNDDPSRIDANSERDARITDPIQNTDSVETAVALDETTRSETTQDKTTQDESAIAAEETGRSIQDAIQEQQDALAQQDEPGRDNVWEVTPNLAPVYYNTIGEGSSIDPSFADNPQNGDVNLSYGVLVGYQVSERLTVRTGLNNVNVGYSTGGIEFGTGPVSSALRSIDYDQTGTEVLSAFDSGSIRPAAPGAENDPFANINLKSTSPDAEIVQNISYFEVPMEVKYALVDKRVGVHMIGGFSTLFLGNNEVSVRDGDFRSTLGEANNLNDLSFSTNVGVGFDYKFSKSFRFVLEPMFKYQLNPYTDSSVDFRPYYLGVYSGLSFKF